MTFEDKIKKYLSDFEDAVACAAHEETDRLVSIGLNEIEAGMQVKIKLLTVTATEREKRHG